MKKVFLLLTLFTTLLAIADVTSSSKQQSFSGPKENGTSIRRQEMEENHDESSELSKDLEKKDETLNEPQLKNYDDADEKEGSVD